MRVRHRVRSNPDATIAVLAKLVPAHRRKLSRIVARKLGDAQRSARARIPGTDEDLDTHPEPLEPGKNGRRAPKGVIEGHVHLPEARQGANLPQQEVGLDREPVLPGRRDGVVTEDERATTPGRHRPQIAQPINTPTPSATANSIQPTSNGENIVGGP